MLLGRKRKLKIVFILLCVAVALSFGMHTMNVEHHHSEVYGEGLSATLHQITDRKEIFAAVFAVFVVLPLFLVANTMAKRTDFFEQVRRKIFLYRVPLKNYVHRLFIKGILTPLVYE